MILSNSEVFHESTPSVPLSVTVKNAMKKLFANPLFQAILLAVQGAVVGIGAILPGVSGGVLCVAFGIYEPMMELLTHPCTACRTYGRMFIPFGVGWLAGFILLAKGIELLFSASPAIALMLFFGLICGTLPELFHSTEQDDRNRSWAPLVLSLSLAYLFFHLLENGVTAQMEASFLGFFFCGILWGLSMILPGFSSSSILICLGLYEPMTAGIAALDPAVLIPMLTGIALAALSLARLVHMLFQHHRAVMSRIVLGFVIASALKIVPHSFASPLALISSLLCFAVGYAVARAMDIAQSKQHETTQKG